MAWDYSSSGASLDLDLRLGLWSPDCRSAHCLEKCLPVVVNVDVHTLEENHLRPTQEIRRSEMFGFRR